MQGGGAGVQLPPLPSHVLGIYLVNFGNFWKFIFRSLLSPPHKKFASAHPDLVWWFSDAIFVCLKELLGQNVQTFISPYVAFKLTVSKYVSTILRKSMQHYDELPKFYLHHEQYY